MCIIFNIQFQELLDAVEHPSKVITERVYAVLSNHPYIAHQNPGSTYYENDVSYLKDLSLAVDILPMMMNLRRCEHMFCSSLQFKTYY